MAKGSVTRDGVIGPHLGRSVRMDSQSVWAGVGALHGAEGFDAGTGGRKSAGLYGRDERATTVRFTISLMALFGSACMLAQSPTSSGSDAFQSLRFLEGEWSAATPGNAGTPMVVGTYIFRRELGGHVLARHSTSASCKAPADFDCEHGDLLYVYVEEPGQRLRAIYFDNEGHVIHYGVSTPAAGSVVFLSDPSSPGPQFRLAYELKNQVMSGKFQVHMPGEGEWKSYLEWSGKRKQGN